MLKKDRKLWRVMNSHVSNEHCIHKKKHFLWKDIYIMKQTLLSVTKERKMWRDKIPHVLNEYGTQRRRERNTRTRRRPFLILEGHRCKQTHIA